MISFTNSASAKVLHMADSAKDDEIVHTIAQAVF